jgi:hypothetical protein
MCHCNLNKYHEANLIPVRFNKTGLDGQHRLAMKTGFTSTGSAQDQLRIVDSISRTVNDEQIFVGLEGNFVLENAVLWNADTHKTSPECADSAHNNGTLKTGDNPANQWSGYENRTQSRYGECRGAK